MRKLELLNHKMLCRLCKRELSLTARFCPSCGDPVKSDEIESDQRNDAIVAQMPASPEPEPLYDFIRKRLVPINAVIFFAMALVAALDLLAPRGPFLSAVAIFLASVILCVMVTEAVAPEALTNWKAKPAKGMGLLLRELWMGRASSLHSPAWMALLGCAMVTLVAGYASKVKAHDGGVIASSNSTARSLQVELGIAQLTEQQHRTNRLLETVVQGVSQLKRETSDNPRKELFNQGIAWKSDHFERSIQLGDTATVKLFLAGEMPITPRAVWLVFNSDDLTEKTRESIGILLAENGALASPAVCKVILGEGNSVGNYKLDVSLASIRGWRKRLVEGVCTSQVGRDLLIAKTQQAATRTK